MTRTQIGVAIGMALAVAATTAIFYFGLGSGAVPPIDALGSLGGRLTLAATAWLAPLAALAASIGFIANFRFFSPADIDGAGLTVESAGLKTPRAILANTHEQATLAALTYAGLALALPERQLILPLLLAAAFLIGRAFFAVGYARGAAARSFGFALTFYPTVAGAVLMAWLLLSRLG